MYCAHSDEDIGRRVSFGISVPGSPEVSQTQWRSVADHSNLVYYYATTYNPSVMWVDLREFDLGEGAPIMKLNVINQQKPYIGNVRDDMHPDKGFVPMFTMEQWRSSQK